VAVSKEKYHGQKQNDELSTVSLDEVPSSPIRSSILRAFSRPIGKKKTSQAISGMCVKDEVEISSPPCEDFSESWHFSNWENDVDDLRSSKLSASICSSNSVYIDLDEFDEDDTEEPAFVIERKRKNLRSVLRADEDLFQTSLVSLNLCERNADQDDEEDDLLDQSRSERQDSSNKGDFNESVLSFLSSYNNLSGASKKEPWDSRHRTSPIQEKINGQQQNALFDEAPSSPTRLSIQRPFSQSRRAKKSSPPTPDKCVKDETEISSSPCEDFSESWHFSNWENDDGDLRFTKSSSSVCSSDSLYIDLDEFDNDDPEEPAYVQRNSLHNILRADEDQFQTSLNSLNIYERNADLGLREDDDALDLSNSERQVSERQDSSYTGDFSESMISFLSS